jgi:hypothetical protein
VGTALGKAEATGCPALNNSRKKDKKLSIKTPYF